MHVTVAPSPHTHHPCALLCRCAHCFNVCMGSREQVTRLLEEQHTLRDYVAFLRRQYEAALAAEVTLPACNCPPVTAACCGTAAQCGAPTCHPRNMRHLRYRHLPDRKRWCTCASRCHCCCCGRLPHTRTQTRTPPHQEKLREREREGAAAAIASVRAEAAAAVEHAREQVS
jgi:hypothetical protein